MSQFLAPALRPEDEEAERSLRPRRLDDFVGLDATGGLDGSAVASNLCNGDD